MLDSIVNYINQNYGSKRGLLNSTKFAMYAQLGMYRQMARVEWQCVERLIFVCSGNICRSPLASQYATESGVKSESFGLACGDNYPADPRAIRFAAQQGLDLSQHRTRNIRHYVPLKGDLIIGMEPVHGEQLKVYRAPKAVQLTLAGVWLQSPRPYIHDPFSASPLFFDKCEREVLTAVNNMLVKARS